MSENKEDKCYCCKTQTPDPIISKSYGVPMCLLCHAGISLMHWGTPSKAAVDANRDKMFSNVERLKNTLPKYGVKWRDPRE